MKNKIKIGFGTIMTLSGLILIGNGLKDLASTMPGKSGKHTNSTMPGKSGKGTDSTVPSKS